MTNEVIEDVVEVPEITPTQDDQGNDTTDWKAIAEANRELALKNQGIAKRFKTKADKAKETKLIETPVEIKEPKKSDDVLSSKFERLALKQAGITHADDIELAQKTAKKWSVDVDEVLADEDFQVKLKRQQDGRANIEATSGVKGSGQGSSTKGKESVEHWIGKDLPPTPADIPDAKVRRNIIQKMLLAKRNNKTLKFYNE